MNMNVSNKEYWGKISADVIIGNNVLPGEELFSRLTAGAMVMDVGCGNGNLAEFVSRQGYNVTGVDINRDAIEQNRNRETEVNYTVADITEKLPFVNTYFDAVLSSFVLCNILPLQSRQKLIRELTRILKPHGILWINEPQVSKGYEKRYEISRPFVDEDHDFFVFKGGVPPSDIKSTEELQKAIEENKIMRLSHHFSKGELQELFSGYELIHEKEAETSSPNTKSVIKMTTSVFRLK